MTIEDRKPGPFSWLFGKEKDTPTRTRARRPNQRDLTGGFVANEEMLKGAYHGTFQGLQFASPLMFTPINIPINMMGLPTPHSDDERTQEVLDEITAMMADRIVKLERTRLLAGTAWRFPRFDAATQALVWEAIPDSSISDILLDIITGKPNAILTDEDYLLSIGENQTQHARRKRRFQSDRVSVNWIGAGILGVTDSTSRNVAGILPINFAHDADEDELRGYSVFSRIIRDLKDYHDIDYMVSQILTQFRPKQKQGVRDVGRWLLNNLGANDPDLLAEYDVSGTDLIINGEDEDTDYVFLPGDATAAHEKAIERKYWKIFEGSGIPEMFWGGLATGNHATADTQMQEAVSYVEAIRREEDVPYYQIYAASLRILSIVRMEKYAEFEMGWNRLESISADVKSQIFQRFAAGLGQLAQSCTLTKKMVYNLWQVNFPEAESGDLDEFLAGIQDMALFHQFVGEQYGSGLEDFQGRGADGKQGNEPAPLDTTEPGDGEERAAKDGKE
jgi:hypothetical protein